MNLRIKFLFFKKNINNLKNILFTYKYSPTEGGVELGEISSIEESMNQEV
jgi:hypothetical protein